MKRTCDGCAGLGRRYAGTTSLVCLECGGHGMSLGPAPTTNRGAPAASGGGGGGLIGFLFRAVFKTIGFFFVVGLWFAFWWILLPMKIFSDSKS